MKSVKMTLIIITNIVIDFLFCVCFITFFVDDSGSISLFYSFGCALIICNCIGFVIVIVFILFIIFCD